METKLETQLEPTTPAEAVDLYIRDKKAEGIQDSTVDKIRFSLNPFLAWAEQNEISNMNVLTPKSLHTYRIWLQERREGGYAPTTLEVYLTDFRALVEHCASYRGVPTGLSETIRIPKVAGRDHRKHIILDESRAEAILDYLERFQYASRSHVIFAVIWDVGLRISALRALDVDDFIREDGLAYLHLVNREDTGTRLKNGDKSERYVSLNQPKTVQVIEDWITHKRPNVTDEFSRKPLVTTTKGRISKDCIKKDVQRITAPCFLGESCEGCQRDNHNRKCPDALSPHPVRRGAITRDLNRGIIPDHVSERFDTSVATIRAHYDSRTDKEKMEVRREAYMRAMQEAIGSR